MHVFCPKKIIGEGRRTATADSHNRLFGEVDRSFTPASKSHSRSNIPIGGDSTDNGTNGQANGYTNGNGHAAAANGNGHAAHHANGNGANGDAAAGAATNGNGLKSGT